MTLIGANSFAIIGPRKMPGARCGCREVPFVHGLEGLFGNHVAGKFYYTLHLDCGFSLTRV